ncbi:hypothetical protein CDIK_3418 [Cucumispora dikerogammari]|nr:hypothetical protein CDIK_3418 [Cucumispora dikerogammari]
MNCLAYASRSLRLCLSFLRIGKQVTALYVYSKAETAPETVATETTMLNCLSSLFLSFCSVILQFSTIHACNAFLWLCLNNFACLPPCLSKFPLFFFAISGE